MKVEGECKDQTQRVGEERDIESAHARWWCVCVRMSDGAGEEMLAATQISGARGGQKRDTGAGRERARGSRQRGGARRAERAIARRPWTGGGAWRDYTRTYMDASAHAHVRIRTPTCTDIHMSVCALYMLERDSHCVCVYILTVALEKARTRWGLKGERRNEGEPRKAVIANEKRARRSSDQVGVGAGG